MSETTDKICGVEFTEQSLGMFVGKLPALALPHTVVMVEHDGVWAAELVVEIERDSAEAAVGELLRAFSGGRPS